jgi:hypothetical protein
MWILRREKKEFEQYSTFLVIYLWFERWVDVGQLHFIQVSSTCQFLQIDLNAQIGGKSELNFCGVSSKSWCIRVENRRSSEIGDKL